ncbi:MAG TPA: glutamate--cysteine ligase [Acidimicrobiia bacterium]|nr:glutamate--cysteine ligase [Acidimicrobiia bacterium]
MDILFNASEGSSLGIEVELQLVDRVSRELRSGASEILRRLEADRGFAHPKAKNELIESNIELITGICSTVAEARADLEGTLGEVAPVAHELGLALCCAGTHPFSEWSAQEITDNERYHRLVEEVQWPARRMAIFGIHTHVGVRSAEKAIAIANALCGYIPHFLALSASSPWWHGRDTGLASTRSKVFEGLPTAGVPQMLGGWDEFSELMTTLISAKSISSIREIWWDIRPHPNFGTVELRICDGLPTMSEITTIAALAQCLVEWMDHLIDRGYTLPCPKAWIVGQNKWRAARYGIDAEIIVDDSGGLAPLRGAIAELVEELTPVARRLGCEKELDHTRWILNHGPSYLRQRRWVEQGATLPDVVDGLIGELRSDEPG